MTTKATGKLIGVGVGPGDPELLTLKAFRTIQRASVLSFLTNAQHHSQAKSIACEAIEARSHAAIEIPLPMPMSTDRRLANRVYDDAAEKIKQQLLLGLDVVFLCEGDPLFFGSFIYLLERLQDQFECESIPGIASINAASSCLVQPLTKLTDSFVIMSGRHSDDQLCQALRDHNSVVIMKAGQARVRILDALQKTNRIEEACYLEYIGRAEQKVERKVSTLAREAGPYFSLFVISRQTDTRT